MATLKLTLFKAKALKDGRHKVRVAVCHKRETCYIVTNVILDSESQFKNGQVVKRPDASFINKRLRNMLNEYQDKLDSIKNQSLYTCVQIKGMLVNSTGDNDISTFKDVSSSYERELIDNGSIGYSKLIERNCRYFTEFVKGDIFLSDITPELIEGYSRFLRNKRELGRPRTP